MGKIKSGDLLKGAAAMLVAAAAIWVFSKAVQELEKVKDWKGVAIGLGLFVATMGLAAAILAIAGPAIGTASLFLIPFSVALLAFAVAAKIAAPAIDVIANALGKFVEKIGTTIVNVIGGVTDAILKLSAINPLRLIALGGSLITLAAGLAAMTASSIIGGVASLFKAGPADMINEIANIDGIKIETSANAIQHLGNSLKNLNPSLLSNVGSGLSDLSVGLEDLSSSDASDGVELLFKAKPAIVGITEINTSRLDAVSKSIEKLALALKNLSVESISRIGASLSDLAGGLVKLTGAGLLEGLSSLLNASPVTLLKDLASIDGSRIAVTANSTDLLGVALRKLTGISVLATAI
jgi:hypothetical protein